MPKYGIAWINNVKKPFIFDKMISRGKNKGKVAAYLTRGRDAAGDIVPGSRVYIPTDKIIECPGDLILKPKKEIKNVKSL